MPFKQSIKALVDGGVQLGKDDEVGGFHKGDESCHVLICLGKSVNYLDVLKVHRRFLVPMQPLCCIMINNNQP